MSALFYLVVLTVFSAAIADPELEAFAQKVLQLLNPNSDNAKTNGLLLQLTNGEHLSYSLLVGKNSSESIRVNVTFAGTVAVSAERNSKKVKVSSSYLGGAALAVNEKENSKFEFTSPTEVNAVPVDSFLNDIYEKNLKTQEYLAADETAVLLGHASGTGVVLKDNARKAEAKIRGGFVVGSKTKVTTN